MSDKLPDGTTWLQSPLQQESEEEEEEEEFT